MANNYERGGGGSAALSLFLSAALFNLGIALGRTVEDTGDKVRDVQITNEQLTNQLGQSHIVDNMIVVPGEHKFEFQEGALTCTGKYEGTKQQAHVVGNLACTQAVPVSK